MDETDRNKIAEELLKHSHLLNMKSTDLYNIANGHVAPTKVNVHALDIDSTQSGKFAALIPDAFHSKTVGKVKTMQEMKKVVIVNGEAIFDIDTLLARLLVVGHQRGVDVTYRVSIFQYELSPVPPSLIDEFGCLRKEDKTFSSSVLVSRSIALDVVLVDARQLLYHVVWPVAGIAADLSLRFDVRLSRYPPEAQ